MGLHWCILRREHCAHFGLWKQVKSDFRYNHCLLYSSLHPSEASKKTTDMIWFFYKTKQTMKHYEKGITVDLFFPFYSIWCRSALCEGNWHDSFQLGDKLLTNGASGLAPPPWAFSLNSHQTPEVRRCFAFLIIQQRLMETLQDKTKRILGSFHCNHGLCCYSGRQWQEDTHSSTSCPPT